MEGVYASAAARARAEEQDLLCCVAEDRSFHLWRLPPVASSEAEATLLLTEASPSPSHSLVGLALALALAPGHPTAHRGSPSHSPNQRRLALALTRGA